MPRRAARRCTSPGCSRTPPPGETKCPRCGKPPPRPSATERGYGVEHKQRFRAEVLARDRVCVLCMRRPAEHADHWPLSKRDLRRAGLDEHDPRHGRGLCASCHSSDTARRHPSGWHRGR